MDELSSKTNIIFKMITMFLSKQECENLIQFLCRHYDISLKDDTEPSKEMAKTAEPEQPASEKPAPKTEERDFPLEVVYFNRNISAKRISGAKVIGVVIPETGKVLYFDGSENSGTRHQAQAYIRNLPYKFDWHLMSSRDYNIIQKHLEQINATLKLINGLPISDRNYMLADDNQRAGYVRYTATL